MSKIRIKYVTIGSSIILINIIIELLIENKVFLVLSSSLAILVGIYLLYRWLMKPIDRMKAEIRRVNLMSRELEDVRSGFVANVTHELKTPLTSISGFVETLQAGAGEDPETRNKFINIIAVETARLKRIIDDILVLSDIETSREDKGRNKIYVRDGLMGVVAIMEPIADKCGVSLNLALEEDVCIAGNEDRFRQMMFNIVENAVKYSEKGGEVWISAQNTDDSIQIKVQDRGIGIEESDLKRIFERFYRVDKSRSRKVGGTGLGLSIVKHIVALLDGEIGVESEVGKGTIFTLVFPKYFP